MEPAFHSLWKSLRDYHIPTATAARWVLRSDGTEKRRSSR